MFYLFTLSDRGHVRLRLVTLRGTIGVRLTNTLRVRTLPRYELTGHHTVDMGYYTIDN